jgi:hypothetical protein
MVLKNPLSIMVKYGQNPTVDHTMPPPSINKGRIKWKKTAFYW